MTLQGGVQNLCTSTLYLSCCSHPGAFIDGGHPFFGGTLAYIERDPEFPWVPYLKLGIPYHRIYEDVSIQPAKSRLKISAQWHYP